MKKWALVFTVAVIGAALPQAGHAQGISLGAKAGLNMADLSGDDISDVNMRTGFTVGAYLTLSTPGMFALQPEVLFSQKGATMEGEILGTSYESHMKSTYIEVPVLLRVGVPMPASPAKPFLFVGPSAGFLLSSKQEVEAGGESEEEDIKDTMKSMDWGAVVGAGLDFGSLSVDLRANFGLSSIDDTPEENDLKNRTFSVMLGYKLPIGL
ncbi:MAG TPA: porin family protein [Longimicrobiales bacterium]